MKFDFVITELIKRFKSAELERVVQCLQTLSISEQPQHLDVLHQPNLLYFPGLASKPWHETDGLEWVSRIETSYTIIKNEILRLLHEGVNFYPYEDPYTRELGWRGWNNYSLYKKGKEQKENCLRCPQTMKLLNSTPHGPRQAMFARLDPGTHLTPHTGGVNVVLTCHLGLLIPEGCAIRVGNETRFWQAGKCLLFDDSFIHEAWNKGKEQRIVLVWDIWHPDLTEVEIESLSYLFPVFEQYLLGFN